MDETQQEETQETEEIETETQEQEAATEQEVAEEERDNEDYDGLKARLDDMMGMIEGLTARLDALGLETVESQGYVDGNIPETIADEMQTKVDQLLGIDALDLL